MVHHNNCPLCSSADISFYLRCPDFLLSKEEFDLIKCRKCGFIFTQDYPEETEIANYYQSDDYISHNDNPAGFRDRIYVLVRNLMLHRKRRIIIKTTGLRRGNLLDIGCGTGHFAGSMKKNGWSVTGIEPNEKARKSGIKQFDINILTPDQVYGLPDRSFDCITLWHVMEHFHNPFKYAHEIKRLLKPDGICIAALPNCDSADARYFGKNWAAWDVPRHLWHFNTLTFERFWKEQGFLMFKRTCLPFDVFYISILSEKNKGSKMSFLTGVFFASVFAMKSALNNKMNSSLIYFIRRSPDQ